MQMKNEMKMQLQTESIRYKSMCWASFWRFWTGHGTQK